MKKVIITGANSFIGRRLTNRLIDRGNHVYAVVRETFKDTEIFKKHNCTIVRCNMEDYSSLFELIEDKCDVGIAMAWNGTRGGLRNDKTLQESNYVYSMDSIENFIRMGCKKIITSGSQAEYGPVNTDRKTLETDGCFPNTEYGIEKLKTYHDSAILCKKSGVCLIEPRYFSLYGEDDYYGTMIISIIRRMISGEKCELTECIQTWDFLHVDDAVNALEELIDSERTKGIYNIGYGESRQLKEYIEIMFQKTGRKSPLLFGAVPYPATGMVNTNPCIDKLKRDTAWSPKVGFEEGIDRVINYQRTIMNQWNSQ